MEYGKITKEKLTKVIDSIFSRKVESSRQFKVWSFCSVEQLNTLNTGMDSFHRAMMKQTGKTDKDVIAWECQEFIKRNNLSKDMAIEFKRCKEGYLNMSGEEYFFYNFIKINGKAPALGTWSKSYFEQYKKNIQTLRNIKRRRARNYSNFLIENPLTPEQAFYKQLKEKNNDNK